MNFQEDCELIVENLRDEDIISLMQSLGADRYEDKGNCIIFPTICHNENAEEASMKLYYYKDNHFFMCYTSCEGMSIFSFLQHYYKTRGIDYDWYEDVFKVAKSCSISRLNFETEHIKWDKKSDKYRKREIVELPEYDNGVMDLFITYYPIEWLCDGITECAMDKFNIKFYPPQNKIVIPHYDVNGRLIGIRGRALNQEEIDLGMKYSPIYVQGQWYKHSLSLNLYGLYQNKNNIKKTGICYIFEAEKSVLQMENFEMPNCAVAICGSSLNIFQIKLLLRECHPKEIVLCLDNEEEKRSDKYLLKLRKICEKYKNYCNFSYIYDTDNLTNKKDSPTDCGEEIFKKLLKSRRVFK